MTVLDYYSGEQLQRCCKMMPGPIAIAIFTQTKAYMKNKNFKDLDETNTNTCFEQSFVIPACEERHHRCFQQAPQLTEESLPCTRR